MKSKFQMQRRTEQDDFCRYAVLYKKRYLCILREPGIAQTILAGVNIKIEDEE